MPPKTKSGQDPTQLEVSGVSVRVRYPRKFGPLYQRFVGHVQEGHDDGRMSYDGKQSPQKLRQVCERLIKDPACVTEQQR